MRLTPIVLAIAVCGIAALSVAQTAPKLKFEVVSVRPCRPDEPKDALRPAPGGQRYIANCVPLRPVIWASYWLQPDQVVGGPDWLDNDAFHIEGIAAGPSTITDLHAMMQDAIAERFNLRFHRQTKDGDVYVLGIDRNGLKNLREHAPTSASDVAMVQVGGGLQEKWTAKSAPIDFIAWRLALKLRRPVIDQTGLRATGYDFELSFTNELPPRPPGALPLNLDTSGPTIFQALLSQLGFTLEGRKGPVETFVIDHIERPSEN